MINFARDLLRAVEALPAVSGPEGRKHKSKVLLLPLLGPLVVQTSLLPLLAVEFRVGIATGPVAAGVLGKQRRKYTVLGETINKAARLESTGVPMCVHMDIETVHSAKLAPGNLEKKTVELKGIGAQETYVVDMHEGWLRALIGGERDCPTSCAVDRSLWNQADPTAPAVQTGRNSGSFHRSSDSHRRSFEFVPGPEDARPQQGSGTQSKRLAGFAVEDGTQPVSRAASATAHVRVERRPSRLGQVSVGTGAEMRRPKSQEASRLSSTSVAKGITGTLSWVAARLY